MILLASRKRLAGSHDLVLLFGVGLIGAAILSKILSRIDADARALPFGWSPDAPFDAQTNTIAAKVTELAKEPLDHSQSLAISIVWSAGTGGFSSPASTFVEENQAFLQVIDLAQLLHRALPEARHSFHLISSAGGLFEGCTLIGASTLPRPVRPYGHAKLEQENQLRMLPNAIRKFIYRPTSVYGYVPSGRTGLVSALVSDSMHRRTTRIFGNPNTIRDYISSDDIGRFVAGNILVVATPGVYLLGSGKPTTVLEIIRNVEGRMQRPIYVQFDTKPANAQNMSVQTASLPAGLRCSPLIYGIYQTADRVIAQFTARPRAGVA